MLPNGVFPVCPHSATLWARLVEWYRYPAGRCSRHGYPLKGRWYLFSGYDGMGVMFCPICEYEEATAKWMPIKSKKRSDDSPMTPSLVTA